MIDNRIAFNFGEKGERMSFRRQKEGASEGLVTFHYWSWLHGHFNLMIIHGFVHFSVYISYF